MSRKHTVLIVVVALSIGVDQLVKWVARQWPEGPVGEWVPGLVRWVHVENVGGVLGVLADWPMWVRTPVFLGAAVGVAIMACLWQRRLPARAWWTPACLGLVVGGMVGNTLDRILRGQVTDVLVLGELVCSSLPVQLQVLDGVPAFNAADACLGMGLVGLAAVVASHFVVVRRRPQTAVDPPHEPG